MTEEVALDEVAEGEHRGDDAGALGELLALRVLAEPDLGEQLLGLGAGLVGVERGQGGEAHVALLLADPVLDDPGGRAAGAQPQAEAGQVVVEPERLGLAGRQGEGGDLGLGELHLDEHSRRGPAVGSGWEAGGCFPMLPKEPY